MESDREAIEAALDVQRLEKTEHPRVVRIKNTHDVGEIEVSETLWREFADHPDLEQAGELADMRFDAQGRLI